MWTNENRAAVPIPIGQASPCRQGDGPARPGLGVADQVAPMSEGIAGNGLRCGAGRCRGCYNRYFCYFWGDSSRSSGCSRGAVRISARAAAGSNHIARPPDDAPGFLARGPAHNGSGLKRHKPAVLCKDAQRCPCLGAFA